MSLGQLTSFPFFKIKSKLPRQAISNDWGERNQILGEDVNLFCWRRPPDSAIQNYLIKALSKSPNPIKIAVDKTNLLRQLDSAQAVWGNAGEAGGPAFWIDVFRLVHDFLDFSPNRTGTVHLRVVENDACKKFHTDGYALRLFTTYLGKGTEWLTEKDTNRLGLGKSNKMIVKDHAQIRKMEPFEVGILKGEPPGSPSKVKGIVHRSPEITSNGEKRIILRVDI